MAITGNVTRNLLGLDSFQEVDITGVTMPITKHNYIVKDVNQLADTIREAFRLANEGRKGPVLVDIPKDISAQLCEYTQKHRKPPRSSPFPRNSVLKRRWSCWKNPSGPSVHRRRCDFLRCCGGSGKVGRKAGRAGGFLPSCVRAVLTRPTSVIWECWECTAPKPQRWRYRIVTCLSLWEPVFSDRVTCNADLFARHCPVIQIDIDPAEFNKNIEVDVKLKGDAKAIVQELLNRLSRKEHKNWMADIARWQAEYPLVQLPGQEGTVTPQQVLETLDRLTDGKAILATEVGPASDVGRPVLPVPQPPAVYFLRRTGNHGLWSWRCFGRTGGTARKSRW